MARPLRMESEAGVYHVLNRGNYRADIFRSDKAKAAFLKRWVRRLKGHAEQWRPARG